MPILTTVCMDCGRTIDIKKSNVGGMSHGLCDTCLPDRRKELEEFKAKQEDKQT